MKDSNSSLAQINPPERDQEAPNARVAAASQMPTVLSKLALGLIPIGLIPFLVGFSTTYWMTAMLSFPEMDPIFIYVGLFKGCTNITGCDLEVEVKPWQYGAAVVALVALATTVLTLVLHILNMFVFKTKTWGKTVRCVTIAMPFIAAASAITLAIVVVCNLNNVQDLFEDLVFEIGWSYIVAIVGGVFFIVIGIILAVDIGQG